MAWIVLGQRPPLRQKWDGCDDHKGRSRKELHFYSTDASISVKRTGPLAGGSAPVFQVLASAPRCSLKLKA